MGDHCCWLAHPPTHVQTAPMVVTVLAFIMLNSVEYEVLSHSSSTIRTQAILLFTCCYLVFFITTSSLVLLHILRPSVVYSTCGPTGIWFVGYATVAATILRFSVPFLQHVSCVGESASRLTYQHMSTTCLVFNTICSALCIVVGVSSHIYASLQEPFAIAAALPYVLAAPLVVCVSSCKDAANPSCVWNMWSLFLYVYVCGISVAWSSCMWETGRVRGDTAMVSIAGVVFTIAGMSMFYSSIASINSPGRRADLSSSQPYMYTY